MQTFNKPIDHLKAALQLIMTAAGDARSLMFFFTTSALHIHGLCKGGENEEEAFCPLPEEDHHYSCLLMLQGVVFPWASEKCTEPSDSMIEGMIDMMGCFGAQGWGEMVTALYVPLSRELSQGAAGMRSVYDTLRIHAALSQCTALLHKYEQFNNNSLIKAA